MLYCMAIMRSAQLLTIVFLLYTLFFQLIIIFWKFILQYIIFFSFLLLFLRLVNGVVEKTRKKEVASIAVAADAIGIPRMLIDIRHGEQSLLLLLLIIVLVVLMEWDVIFVVVKEVHIFACFVIFRVPCLLPYLLLQLQRDHIVNFHLLRLFVVLLSRYGSFWIVR